MAKKQSEEHSEEITNQIREVRFGYKLGLGPREGRVVHWPISIYANGKMSEFLRSRSASSHLAEICQQRILRRRATARRDESAGSGGEIHVMHAAWPWEVAVQVGSCEVGVEGLRGEVARDVGHPLDGRRQWQRPEGAIQARKGTLPVLAEVKSGEGNRIPGHSGLSSPSAAGRNGRRVGGEARAGGGGERGRARSHGGAPRAPARTGRLAERLPSGGVWPERPRAPPRAS